MRCLLLPLALISAPIARGESPNPDLLTGRAALEDGLYELAQEKFEQYIQKSVLGGAKLEGSVYLIQSLYGQAKYLDVVDWMSEHRAWWEGTPEEGAMKFWLARSLYQLGRFEEARENLRGYQNQYPDDLYLPQALRLRAHVALRLGDFDEAYGIFEGFHRRYAGQPEAADNLLDWASLLLSQHRQAEAEKLLRQIIADYGTTGAAQDSLLWLGRVKLQEGEADEARDLLTQLTEQPEADRALVAQAWYGLGELAAAETNFEAAVKAAKRGEQATGDPGLGLEGRILRAQWLARQGQVQEAVKLLTESIRTLPTHPRAGQAQLALGDVLLQDQQFEDALAAFQHYLEAFTDPAGEARALLGKGWSLWHLGRYAEAAGVFGKAAEAQSDPEDKRQALVKQADAYAANGQFKLALEAYQRIAADYALSPGLADVWLQVAQCQLRLDALDAAEATLTRVRKDFAEQPAGEEAWMRLAGLAERRLQWKQALAIYDEFLSARPQSPRVAQAQLGRAQARVQLGLLAEALADLDQVAHDQVGTPWAEQAIFLKVWCLDLQGESRRAAQVCEEFLASHSESPWAPDALFWLAQQDFNGGRYAAAEERFEELARRYPRSAVADDALYWAGRAAAGQDEFRRAVTYFNDLIKTYTNSPKVAEARFAQGDALSEMGEFAGAILAFDDIIRNFAGSALADRAWGRKADCQFTLGSDKPERYQEALASYRSVMDSPTASPDLKMQAEFKIGRCYEKMGRRAEALGHYMNVVYEWFAQRTAGGSIDPVWFIRSAFNAAAMKEAEGKWEEAVNIYQRVSEAGVPASADALKRLERIKAEQWPAARPEGGPGGRSTT